MTLASKMLGPYPRIAPAIYGDIEYTRRHSVRLVRRDSENRNLVLIVWATPPSPIVSPDD